MTFDFGEPGGKGFLKKFNLFNLSHGLTTIFIIKVCFPAKIRVTRTKKEVFLIYFNKNKVDKKVEMFYPNNF